MIKARLNKIYYSAQAKLDLDEIYEYIDTELCNPMAANQLITEILDAVEGLQAFPESGKPLSTIVEGTAAYRYLIVKNYLVFYRTENQSVFIDRILYGGRNYLKILFDIEISQN